VLPAATEQPDETHIGAEVDVASWLQAAADAEPPEEPAPAEAASPTPAAAAWGSAPSAPAPLQALRPGDQVCAACGVAVSGQRNWEEHVGSKRHLRRVQAEAAAAGAAASGADASSGLPVARAPSLLQQQPAPAQAPAPYVCQRLTSELNAAVEALLRQLLEWQRRAAAADPANARRKRRLVSGLREVTKAAKMRKAKLVIVAPNVGTVALPAGEEDDGGGGGDGGCPVSAVLAVCAEQGVPVAFALSRARLGRVLGQRKSASAFAVLDASGAEAQLKAALALAQTARQEWEAGAR
jgi:ribosomal protein L7Ae-like RNA K-turn-binding protein